MFCQHYSQWKACWRFLVNVQTSNNQGFSLRKSDFNYRYRNNNNNNNFYYYQYYINKNNNNMSQYSSYQKHFKVNIFLNIIYSYNRKFLLNKLFKLIWSS